VGKWHFVKYFQDRQAAVYVGLIHLNRENGSTVELHLSGLIGTASLPDMQKTRIILFFFENRLDWQSEVFIIIIIIIIITLLFAPSTVELHISGLIGMARHTDMQKIRIIGLFFENWLHWQFEVRLLLFTVCTCV